MVQATRLLHESRRRQVDARNRIEERLAARQPGPGVGRLEIGERRQDLRERVRLVLEPAERDAWHYKNTVHNQQLEQRGANIIDEAGVENDCVFMALDRDIVPPVYFWTVNDPAWMLVGLSLGIDVLVRWSMGARPTSEKSDDDNA